MPPRSRVNGNDETGNPMTGTELSDAVDPVDEEPSAPNHEDVDVDESDDGEEPGLTTEIEAAIEAILFVSAEPVSRERIESVFRKKDGPLVEVALQRLRERYRPTEDEPSRGLILDEVAGGLRIVTRPDLHGHLRKYFEVSGSNRLSMAALETLATIGYRQPITLPEIQELRGKNSSGVIKTLLERRLIRISGRKDVVGKPFLYSTTRDFLLHFGLSRIEDLPPLEEFEETFGVDAGEQKADDDREEEVMQQLAIVEDEESERFDQGEADSIEQERVEAEGEDPDEEIEDEAAADRGSSGGPSDETTDGSEEEEE